MVERVAGVRAGGGGNPFAFEEETDCVANPEFIGWVILKTANKQNNERE